MKLKYVPKNGDKAYFPTLQPGQVFDPQGQEEWFLSHGCFEVVEEDEKKKTRAKKAEPETEG